MPADRDDEITRLGHTLNHMLDRLEASAGRERRSPPGGAGRRPPRSPSGRGAGPGRRTPRAGEVRAWRITSGIEATGRTDPPLGSRWPGGGRR
ncbi:HAMP domain-containing protein [Streptomyces sp. NPDC048282]|uniref:HAMP domain-containing protein n=1 Tax=unclassified Streptomyces TaxID=2593676 RepID=UPI003713FE5A